MSAFQEGHRLAAASGNQTICQVSFGHAATATGAAIMVSSSFDINPPGALLGSVVGVFSCAIGWPHFPRLA